MNRCALRGAHGSIYVPMLKIEKVFCPDGSLEITMIGPVDEMTDLEISIGQTPLVTRVKCSQVTRLNSIGIKHWIRYFEDLKKQGKKVIFLECSVPIVFALGMLSNFTAGYSVESLMAEYACEKCNSSFDVLYTVEKLRRMGLVLPEMACKTCGTLSQCAEGPDYLEFLKDSSFSQTLGTSS